MTTNHVLARVMLEAEAPDWSPLASARRIGRYVDGDVERLRGALADLLATVDGSSSRTECRALAMLTVAIADLTDG